MQNLIRLSGFWGYILTLLALVVIFLTVRAVGRLMGGTSPSQRSLREDLNGLLFWGGVAAIIGFLGQCQGAYLALEAIFNASEISPNVVAEGFVISFVPTLFGLGILGFSISAWGCLKLLASGQGRTAGAPIALLLLLPVFCSGCSEDSEEGTPLELTAGVWTLEAGPDDFLWEFTKKGNGLACIVHTLTRAAKQNETPCVTASAEGSRISVSMDTGVRLVGELAQRPNRIVGSLHYPDGSETEVDLPWHPREDYPALLPLPQNAGFYSYRPPEDRRDGWRVSSAAEEGIDPSALEETVAGISRGEAGVIHSLLVFRHGHLVFEEYFHGFGPDDLHRLASCTKSVSSLLAGLAIQRGAIPGVHTPVVDFFPDFRDVLGDGWEELTLKHLLTMSMALDWSPEEVETLHGSGPEFFQRVLARSVSGSPGEDWAYVSANVNLLAGVLFEATGQHADAFAKEALFGPLGIERWSWDGLKTDGYNLMDGSLHLRPRDMGKIGQMVLDGGAWDGRRVVDEEWIRASTARHLDAGDGTQGYGYLWWRMDANVPGGSTAPVILANGWGSQFIAILPDQDLVFVTTGGNDYNGKHLAPAAVLERYLLPGVNGAES